MESGSNYRSYFHFLTPHDGIGCCRVTACHTNLKKIIGITAQTPHVFYHANNLRMRKIYKQTHTYKHAYTHKHTRARAHTHTRMHTHTYTKTHICIHTRTLIHTHQPYLLAL